MSASRSARAFASASSQPSHVALPLTAARRAGGSPGPAIVTCTPGWRARIAGSASSRTSPPFTGSWKPPMYSSRAWPAGAGSGTGPSRRGRGVGEHLDVAGAVVLLDLAGARGADAEHLVGVAEGPAERGERHRVDALAEGLELGLAHVHLEDDRRPQRLGEHRADRLAVHAAAHRRVEVHDAVAGAQAEAGEGPQRLREHQQPLLHGPALVGRDDLQVVQLGERRRDEAGDDRGHAAPVAGVGPEGAPRGRVELQGGQPG